MSAELWLAIVILGTATYLIRASFLVAGDRAPLPAAARRSLRFIPLAVLPALVAPAIVRVEPPADAVAIAARLVAASIAGLVAWRTRSLPLTIAVGLAILVIFQLAGARVG